MSGILEGISSLAKAGFDTIDVMGKTVGSGLEGLYTSFFPSPQKISPIKAQSTQPVGFTGLSYRPTEPQHKASLETVAQAALDWIDSPYEEQYGPSQVMLERSNTKSDLWAPWDDFLGKVWEGATTTFGEINKQLPEILMRKIGLIETPEIVNTAGTTEYHVYGVGDDPNRAAPATTPATTADQPKYSFNLGFLPEWLRMGAARVPDSETIKKAGGGILAGGWIV
ncbi:MAG: hypothetical protein DRP65_04230, partial [Planctomycetota bacterium]